MTRAEEIERRIAIALEPEARATVALDILRHVIDDTGHGLIGFFVEDDQMLAHARSSHATEVVLTGARRPLRSEALERQLRGVALEVRKTFESIASKLGLPHMFETGRGDIVAELARMAEDAGMIVVCLAGRRIGPRTWWGAAIHRLAEEYGQELMFIHEGWTTGTSILTYLDGSAHSRRALRVAVRLAKISKSPLKVLIAQDLSEEIEDLDSELGRAGRDYGISAHVMAIPGGDIEDVAKSVITENARLLVLPRHESGRDGEWTRRILTETHCPLLLV